MSNYDRNAYVPYGNVATQAQIDQGLRSYMMGVYNYMALGVAFTAIIVQHLELNMGPNLVLNSDYNATNVPVPGGIKGAQQVILTQ